jgi:hypothetical protein
MQICNCIYPFSWEIIRNNCYTKCTVWQASRWKRWIVMWNFKLTERRCRRSKPCVFSSILIDTVLINVNVFVVAPCMLVVLSPLFVQLMYTNYYKTVKQLKSFKIIIVAPTCFSLHEPSSGAFSLCFTKVTVLTAVTYRYLKLSVLWLHILFSPVMRVDRALCTNHTHNRTEQNMQSQYR